MVLAHSGYFMFGYAMPFALFLAREREKMENSMALIPGLCRVKRCLIIRQVRVGDGIPA